MVVVFRPEILPPGALTELGPEVLTLGFNTEPLPRGQDGRAHPDQLFRLSELAQTDVAPVRPHHHLRPAVGRRRRRDAACPSGARCRCRSTTGSSTSRRSCSAHPPRTLFLGYSTTHREAGSIDVKHHFDLLHVAHGLQGEKLRDLFGRVDVAINLHGEPYPSFENRVCLHLAAGHLVPQRAAVARRTASSPGIDFLEMRSPGALAVTMEALHRHPGLHDAIRRRGRRKAEQFRASRVWPRLVGDLVRDVAAQPT